MKKNIFILTALFAFLFVSNAEVLIQKSWTMGPLPIDLPAFDKVKNTKEKTFDYVQLLNVQDWGKNNVFSSSDQKLTWNNSLYSWSPVSTSSISFPMMASRSQIGLVMAKVHVLEFVKATLFIDTREYARVFVDGVSVFDKNTTEHDTVAIQRSKKEIHLEPGFHTLAVQMLSTGQNKAMDLKFGFLKDSTLSDKIKVLDNDQTFFGLKNYLEGTVILSSRISYDGAYYALTYKNVSPVDRKFEYYTDLYKTSDQSFVRRFQGVSSLCFSKNKLEMAYIASKDKQTYISTYSIATNKDNIVYSTSESISGLMWDPNGNYLLFYNTLEATPLSSGLKLLENMFDRQPSWRNRTSIQKLDLASGLIFPLTAGNSSCSIHDISADGKEILFSQSFADNTARPYSKQKMFLMNLDSLNPMLLWEQNYGGSVYFSPDGTQLLILGSAAMFNNVGSALPADVIPNDYDGQAYLLPLASFRKTGVLDLKTVSPISKNFDPSISDGVWDKNNKVIYFLATAKDKVCIYSYTLASATYTQIPTNVDVVSTFDVSFYQTNSNKLRSSPMFLYCGSSAIASSKAFVYNQGRSLMVADPQKEYLKNVKLGEVKDWSFQNANGEKIDATYYLPPSFDSTKKYPMIVYYYGGTTPTPRIFDIRYPKNTWAALDYVVLVLQPSGAIGYGQAFSAKHVNNWGKTVADEIIRGTKEFCLQSPFVDMSRIGCIGASYGGFMTQLLLSKTDLFATGISHAGISSLSSYWGEGYWGYLYSSAATANSFPWNRTDLYVDQSPLFRADKFSGSLLLLHGNSDKNVPIGESYQLYAALKLLGKPVEMVEIDGEDHGVVNPAKRVLWEKTILAWFAKTLKGEEAWWSHLYPPTQY